jgi:hypothetical protein
MDILSTDQTFNELNYASTNVVYISLPDSSSTCGSWLSKLPSLPSGWSYRCSATPTNIDGTGWIPIPFNNFDILNISQLFIDPINKPPYYYSFVVGGSYEVEAKLESNFQASLNDNGDSGGFYEIGTNLKLTPPEARSGSRLTKDDVDKILKISCPTCSQGLVGYWPFDEGSGTIAKDYSGNGNNGTLVNGPTWTTGKVGGALSFDGVDDYVNVNNVNPFQGNFTVALWLNFSQVNKSTDNAIVGNGTPTFNQGLHLGERGGKAYFGFYNNDTAGNQSLVINRWYHITFIYDGAQKIYIDGSRDAIRSTSGYQSSLLNTEIGRYPWAQGHLMKGLIDEVRIYNRALSDAEIKAL